MTDRKMMKYKPFNSVVNVNSLVNDVEKTRNKINKPILSEDDYIEIEYNLIYSFNEGIGIIIQFYKDGYLNEVKDKVISFDRNKKRVILKSNTPIYFNQIVKVICL